MEVLDCPSADVSAADLGLRLNGPRPQALSTTMLHGSDDLRLELDIIGASHTASVYRGETLLFREEISCHCEGPLPQAYGEMTGYELKTDVAKHGADSFAAEFQRLSGTDWHSAQFPGQGEYHVTALKGTAPKGCAGFEWETVHMYPAEEIIVKTTSRWVP